MDTSFIIPAIDIAGGRCVRLTQGDFEKEKIYATDPVELAMRLENAGFTRLHLVDLDGARYRELRCVNLLEKIASQTSLVIDYGGGVCSRTDVDTILKAGASMVTIGSLAVREPATVQAWADEFGGDNFFIGADVKEGTVRLQGWKVDSGINIYDFIGSVISMGLTRIFCTDIEKDGMLQGPSLSLYRSVLEQFQGIQLFASGGVSTEADLVALRQAGCAGAIVGKALLEGKLSFTF
jgi:phosphoribosylformimino-5-aminoimidazole carboxamide ribotide isomerase